MQQLTLIEKDDREKVIAICRALRKRGQHSLYCRWNGEFYERKPCDCGLDEALAYCDDLIGETES